MLKYAEALKLLLDAVPGSLGSDEVPLSQAAGHVLARAVTGTEDLPRFDNSSMDGYAVVASETSGATADRPVKLKVKGSVSAGDPPPEVLKATGAYEIMTGAPVPPGFDAVVRVEDTRASDGTVEVLAPAKAGDYLRRRGADFAAGARVAEAGTPLDARHLLAFAALGIDRVPVRRRPKVALISTGKELAEPGTTPNAGGIRNSTAAYLVAALPACGAAVRWHGTCPDDPLDFHRRVEEALASKPDILMTTGAVSMGRHDFVANAFQRMGVETLWHKVAIRPGKPGLAGRFKGGPLVFGVPGNPVSTVVGLRFFVLPVLRRLLGLPDERPFHLPLAEDTPKPEGLRCFFKARVLTGAAGKARVLPGQASFQVRPLLEANAWVVLPEEGAEVAAGTVVEAYPILPGPADWEPA